MLIASTVTLQRELLRTRLEGRSDRLRDRLAALGAKDFAILSRVKELLELRAATVKRFNDFRDAVDIHGRPQFARLSSVGSKREEIADKHPTFRRAKRFGPDGMRWLVPQQVLRARSSLSTPGSTSPGPTCLAINDRLP
jgi:hypothetical protein